MTRGKEFDNQGIPLNRNKLIRYSTSWFNEIYEKVEQSELIFKNSDLMLEISQIGRETNLQLTLPRW